MDSAEQMPMLESRCDGAVAASLAPEHVLVYRSNLRSGDRRFVARIRPTRTGGSSSLL